MELAATLTFGQDQKKEDNSVMEEKKLRTAAYCRVSTPSDTQDGSYEVFTAEGLSTQEP
jgi:hypothetical protein